jgi:DNA-binding PadR family transcriptional regulator
MIRTPIQRLEEKVYKENLWIFLFKLLEEKDEYAYELRKKTRENFGFWTGKVTGYRVLYLVEKKGYVTSYMKGRKKYYTLTDKGKEQLRKAKTFFEKMKDTL